MPKTLLHLDSSPLGDHSISRHLTAEYTRNWKLANPDGVVITRDTTTSNIPHVDAAWITAVYTPEASLSDAQRELLALSDTLLDELLTADEYVFGVPLHNFSIPSTLKLWIDQIARVNKTFSYANGTPQGLLTGKKATILIAAGGKYDAGTAFASYNHAEPYLRDLFGFLGVRDTTVLLAGGASALRSGVSREDFLAPHEAAIRSQFQPA
jgi:FMN-dependent NADH-azoreductase